MTYAQIRHELIIYDELPCIVDLKGEKVESLDPYTIYVSCQPEHLDDHELNLILIDPRDESRLFFANSIDFDFFRDKWDCISPKESK